MDHIDHHQARLEAIAAELIAHNRWTRAQLLEHQRWALRRTLEHAVAQSPFHRERLGALVARGAPMEELPVMTKADLVSHFSGIVTAPGLGFAAAEAHVAGPDPGGILPGGYRLVATGGTTGQRAIIAYDEEAWLSGLASVLRAQSFAKLPPGARVAGIGASSPVHLSNRIYAALRRQRADVPELTLSMPIAEVVAGLNACRPDAVVTYPSYLRLLAAEQKAGRLDIAPRALFTVAEALCREVEDLAMEAWGVGVTDRYNSTETFASCSECRCGCGIHLAEDLVIYESVDERNRPVPDGAPGARLLITTLANRAMPLIRYEMSDMVAITRAPCACGMPYARITALKGRREEVMELPAADGTLHRLPAGVLRGPLIRIAGLAAFQFAPVPDGLRVLFSVHAGGDAASVRREIGAALRQGLVANGIDGVAIRIEQVDAISRTGTGEKERLVLQP